VNVSGSRRRFTMRCGTMPNSGCCSPTPPEVFFQRRLFYTDPNPINALWEPGASGTERPCVILYEAHHGITNAIVDESARWEDITERRAATGQITTRNNQWLLELNNLLVSPIRRAGNTANYFPNRSATVRNQQVHRAVRCEPPIFNTQAHVPSVSR